MDAMASQITNLTIVYSTVCSVTNQRKHQSSASLAFVRGIHRWPVNSPHKWSVTRKMFPFDDVIMIGGRFDLASSLQCHCRTSGLPFTWLKQGSVTDLCLNTVIVGKLSARRCSVLGTPCTGRVYFKLGPDVCLCHTDFSKTRLLIHGLTSKAVLTERDVELGCGCEIYPTFYIKIAFKWIS